MVETLKKTLLISMSALAIIGLSGCARNISPNVYKASHVGETSMTYAGSIISMRNVVVDGSEELGDNHTGMLAGAAAGGLAGSAIGDGTGQLAAIGAGALLGGIGGAFAERELKRQEALEYVVRLDNGNAVTVVQGKDMLFQPGQRVFVIVGQNGRSRIIPNQSVM